MMLGRGQRFMGPLRRVGGRACPPGRTGHTRGLFSTGRGKSGLGHPLGLHPFADPFFFDFAPRNARPDPKLMATDICETDSQFTLKVEIPGVPKESIKVEVQEGTLRVSSDKAQPPLAEGERMVQQESTTGSCTRSWSLPENVAPEQIACKHQDGILWVTIPKQAPKEPESRSITIESVA